MDDLLSRLPARRGHFLLESGYHTDLWLTLDALFVDQVAISPLVDQLAKKLSAHRVTAVCGPFLGGAFLAHALANRLSANFYFAEPVNQSATGMFKAQYRVPAELKKNVANERVAVVDDVISAGSSVRATIAELESSGAIVAAVGTFLMLGDVGAKHFAEQEIPVECLGRSDFNFWAPESCPHCASGTPLEQP